MALDTKRFRTDGDREIAQAQRKLARESLAEALHGLIAPVYRIVDGGVAGQPQQAEGDDIIKCIKCGEAKRCALDCDHWHATLRGAVENAPETFETCTVCDMPNDPSILCCERKCPRRADSPDNLA